jgi:DNA-3-methyladenine glycosylase I
MAGMTYCDAAPGHPFHGPYHDEEYGFPIRDDDRLFERLVLEINQAGLSWLTILKKRDAFRDAFADFEIADEVARFDARNAARASSKTRHHPQPREDRRRDREREAHPRHAKSHGSFAAWLDAHHPREKAEWVKLFKKTFVFTGGEITGEFLMNRLPPRAHVKTCPSINA